MAWWRRHSRRCKATNSRSVGRTATCVLSCPLPQQNDNNEKGKNHGSAAAASADLETVQRSRFTPFSSRRRSTKRVDSKVVEKRSKCNTFHSSSPEGTVEGVNAFQGQPLLVQYHNYNDRYQLLNVSSNTTVAKSITTEQAVATVTTERVTSRRTSRGGVFSSRIVKRRDMMMGASVSLTIAHSIWSQPARAADAGDWSSPGLAKPTSNPR